MKKAVYADRLFLYICSSKSPLNMSIENQENYTLQIYQQSNGDVICVHDPKSISQDLQHILNKLMTDTTIKHEKDLTDSNARKILRITIESIENDVVIIPPIFISSEIEKEINVS